MEIANLEFNKVDKGKEYTVVQQAMEQIQNLIVAGHYKPGDRLPTETELASRFGISRSSLREAIKLFNYLGVLESRVAKGTFVCEKNKISGEVISLFAILGQKSVYEIVEFSASVLLWCSLQLADGCQKSTAQYSKYIVSLEKEMARYKVACDLGNLASIDKCMCKIQEIIADSTENNVFITLTKSLHMFSSNINRTVQANLYSQNEVTYNVYSALIAAIESGDTVSVCRVIRDLSEIEKNRIDLPIPPLLDY